MGDTRDAGTLEASKRKIGELTDRLAGLRLETDELTALVQDERRRSGAELEGLLERTTAIISELESVRAERDGLDRQLNEVGAATASAHELQQAEVRSLRAERQRLQHAIEHMSGDEHTMHAQATSEHEKHEGDVAVLRKDLECQQQRYVSLTQARAKQIADEDALTRRVGGLADDVEARERSELAKRDALRKHERELADLRARQHALDLNCASAAERAVATQAAIGDKYEEAAKLQARLNEALLATREASAERDAASDATAKLVEEINVLRAERDALGDKLGSSESTVAALDAQLQAEHARTRELRDVSRGVDDMERDVGALRETLSGLHARQSEAASRVAALETERLSGDAALHRARDELDRLAEALRESEDSARSESVEVAELDAELERERATSRARRDALDASAQNCTIALAARAALEKHFESEQAELAERAAAHKSNESSLEEMRREEARLTTAQHEFATTVERHMHTLHEAREAAALMEEVETLRAQLAALRAQLIEAKQASARRRRNAEAAADPHEHVFVGVIEKLRAELDDEDATRQRLQAQLAGLQNGASQLSHVEEEVETLKRAAPRVREEKGVVELAIARSRQRGLTLTQARDASARDAQRARDAEAAAEAEAVHVRELIEREKRRVGRLAVERSENERKAAETTAASNRSEAMLRLLQHETRQFEQAIDKSEHGKANHRQRLSHLEASRRVGESAESANRRRARRLGGGGHGTGLDSRTEVVLRTGVRQTGSQQHLRG